MIQLLDTGIVYRNPAPHLRAIHAMHPTLAQSPDGELVAAFDLGQGPESFDYAPHVARSGDGGRTWSAPARMFTDDHPRRCTHLARIGSTRDGALTAIGARLFRDSDEEGLVNRANFGYVPMDLLFLSSRDKGRTWDGPRVIQPPLVGPSFEICHPIRERVDGTLIAPMSTWKGWDGAAPNGMKAIALVSRDGGRSWPEYIDVMDDWANGVMHLEQSVVELADGRLLAVAWAFHEQSGKSLPTPYAICSDGRTFGPRRATGLKGQTAKLLALPDGKVLMLYRRDDKPGLWANLSRLDGSEWVNLEEAPMWQGAASGMRGEAAAGQELSDLRFGFPNLLLLRDGSVMAAFWCREDCISNIRWLRLRVA